MRVWLIKMLYRSLSPSGQWECQRHVKCSPINDIMKDTCDKIDRAFARSVTGKEAARHGETIQ